MSTDTFEDQLRSLLHDTADAEGPAFVDVDPNAVVTTGRRVIRRRRLATGAGIAAAVLAIGAGSTLVGGVGRERAAVAERGVVAPHRCPPSRYSVSALPRSKAM